MLYKIQDTNLHLMGTMHLVPVGQEKWKDPVRRAFEAAEVRYVEMHQSSGARVFTEEAASAKLLPDDVLGPISSFWKTTALPPIETCNLPGVWFAAGNMGMTFAHGVEWHLEEWYGESSMLELESPSQFLDGFSHVPLSDYVSTLRKRIPSPAGAKKNFEATYNAWRRHDTKKLAELMRRDVTPSIYDAIYTRRNVAWAATLAKEARSGKRVLALFGAGHLCGKGSLLEVLERDHGLSVVRIPA